MRLLPFLILVLPLWGDFETLYFYYNKSLSLEQAEKYQEAIDALAPLGLEKPDYTLSLRLGHLYQKADRPLEARPFFLRAVTLAPLSIDARTGYLKNLMALDEKNKARELAQSILALEPGNPAALVALTDLDILETHFREAQNRLLDRLQYHPGDTLLLAKLAQAYHAAGSDAMAARVYQNLLILDPTHWQAREFLLNYTLPDHQEATKETP